MIPGKDEDVVEKPATVETASPTDAVPATEQGSAPTPQGSKLEAIPGLCTTTQNEPISSPVNGHSSPSCTASPASARSKDILVELLKKSTGRMSLSPARELASVRRQSFDLCRMQQSPSQRIRDKIASSLTLLPKSTPEQDAKQARECVDGLREVVPLPLEMPGSNESSIITSDYSDMDITNTYGRIDYSDMDITSTYGRIEPMSKSVADVDEEDEPTVKVSINVNPASRFEAASSVAALKDNHSSTNVDAVAPSSGRQPHNTVAASSDVAVADEPTEVCEQTCEFTLRRQAQRSNGGAAEAKAGSSRRLSVGSVGDSSNTSDMEMTNTYGGIMSSSSTDMSADNMMDDHEMELTSCYGGVVGGTVLVPDMTDDSSMEITNTYGGILDHNSEECNVSGSTASANSDVSGNTASANFSRIPRLQRSSSKRASLSAPQPSRPPSSPAPQPSHPPSSPAPQPSHPPSSPAPQPSHPPSSPAPQRIPKNDSTDEMNASADSNLPLSLGALLHQCGISFLDQPPTNRRQSSIGRVVSDPKDGTATVEDFAVEATIGQLELESMIDATEWLTEATAALDLDVAQYSAASLSPSLAKYSQQSVDELEEQLQLIKKRSRVDARLHWVLRKLSNEQSALARTRQMLQAIAGDCQVLEDVEQQTSAIRWSITTDRHALAVAERQSAIGTEMAELQRTLDAEQQQLAQATSATKQARAALDALNAQRSALKSASVAVEGRSNELAAATQELDVLRICSAWQHVSLSSTQIRIQLQQRWQVVIDIVLDTKCIASLKSLGRRDQEVETVLIQQFGIPELVGQISSLKQLPTALQQIGFRLGRLGSLLDELSSIAKIANLSVFVDEQRSVHAALMLSSSKSRTQFSVDFTLDTHYPSAMPKYKFTKLFGKISKKAIDNAIGHCPHRAGWLLAVSHAMQSQL